MGDPKRPHKQYSRPKRPYDKTRIDEERALIKKYGLKNKKELWNAESYIGKIRTQAKRLILHPEQQEIFLMRLIKLGLIKKNESIDDVLSLTKEKLLERRLQTIVFKKKIAKSIREARQLVVHRKIKVNDAIINIPSYLVKIDEENKISKIEKQKRKQKEGMSELQLPKEAKEKEEESKDEDKDKDKDKK